MKLSTATEERLHKLLRVFLEENQKLNLSSLRSEESCWIGNILDSIALLELLKNIEPKTINHKPLNLADIGTGGGFPLLPLAIALPEHHFTGIDSTKKKIGAVNRIIETLHITNAHAIAERAEVLGHDPRHREHYDIVLSRAVAELPTLLEYCSPFAKIGLPDEAQEAKAEGYIVLWKSLSIEQELSGALHAAKEFHCELVMRRRYTLPGDFGERQLLVFQKKEALPEKYPRAVGIPKKKPLL